MLKYFSLSFGILLTLRAGNNIFGKFKDCSQVGERFLVGEPVVVTCKVLEKSRREGSCELN